MEREKSPVLISEEMVLYISRVTSITTTILSYAWLCWQVHKRSNLVLCFWKLSCNEEILWSIFSRGCTFFLFVCVIFQQSALNMYANVLERNLEKTSGNICFLSCHNKNLSHAVQFANTDDRLMLMRCMKEAFVIVSSNWFCQHWCRTLATSLWVLIRQEISLNFH